MTPEELERYKTKQREKVKNQIPLILMCIWPVTELLLFSYLPMFGEIIAFQDYTVGAPFVGPNVKWVGFEWFKLILSSNYFLRLLRNTFRISLISFLLSAPLKILLALLLNEIRNKRAKKVITNITILPHFISTVIVVGIVMNLFAADGLINTIRMRQGLERIQFLTGTKYFLSLYMGSGFWASTGFGAVAYSAAIAAIDQEMYDAALIDGSTRWKNVWYVTLPNIMPTIIIFMILDVGNLMSVGCTKLILMYNETNWEVSDVFSTYAYRMGIEGSKQSLSTALGLMNATVSLILITTFNRVARKVSETSLW